MIQPATANQVSDNVTVYCCVPVLSVHTHVNLGKTYHIFVHSMLKLAFMMGKVL